MKSVKLSSFLGISRTKLRILEKSGIILPSRDDSGERVYSSADVINILESLRVSGYGISMKEISNLKEIKGFNNTFSSLSSLYFTAINNLQNTISSSLMLMPVIQENYNVLSSLHLNTGNHWIEHKSAMVSREFGYFFPDDSNPFINTNDSLDEWINYLPFCFIELIVVFDPETHCFCGRRWVLLMNKVNAGFLNISETEKTRTIEECNALTTVVKIHKSEEDLMSEMTKMIEYAADHNLRLSEDNVISARMCLHTVEDGTDWYYYILHLPVSG